MRCHWPNCLRTAEFMPVIELPTYRTVAMDEPSLNREIVNNPAVLAKSGLPRNMVIQQYEEAVQEYKLRSGQLAKTDKPTYLMGKELCRQHKESYKFSDWLPATDWAYLQEVARSNGYEILNQDLVIITFRPLGWTPGASHLELER